MEYKLWINGQWVDSMGSCSMSVENPTTDQKIVEVVDACPADVDLAEPKS